MMNFFESLVLIICLLSSTSALCSFLYVIYKLKTDKEDEEYKLFDLKDVFNDDPLMDTVLFETEVQKEIALDAPIPGRGSIRLGKYNRAISMEKYIEYKQEVLSYKLP